MNSIRRGTALCNCTLEDHPPLMIALTGGTGAGKTAVLELATRTFCKHIVVLPEAASIIFGNGFPRKNGDIAKAAQRVIFHWQREIEHVILAHETDVAAILCDRGTVDGLAYWNGPKETFFDQFGTSLAEETSHYAAVVHLHTPDRKNGYNKQNELRNETPEEAQIIDEHIFEAWRLHPNRIEVHNTPDFLDKATTALQIVRDLIPDCCDSVK